MASNLKFAKEYLNSDYYAYGNFFFLFIGFSGFMNVFAEKFWNIFPTFCIAYVALFFSYHSYKFSKEKFRLDLYDQRLIFTNDLLIFLSKCLDSISQQQKDELANNCIQGLGILKAKSLFGHDIISFLGSIHFSYCVIQTYPNAEAKLGLQMYSKDEDEKKRYKKSAQILQAAPNSLAEVFSPYIYFGDYRAARR